MNGKFNTKMGTIKNFFPQIWDFFRFLKKDRRGLPSCPPPTPYLRVCHLAILFVLILASYICLFVFQKTCIKVKVQKMFLVTLTWKHADLSNRGLFWKFTEPFFKIAYALSVGFTMKPPGQGVFLCQGQNQLKFCRKSC